MSKEVQGIQIGGPLSQGQIQLSVLSTDEALSLTSFQLLGALQS